MANLFNRERSVITKHLSKVFREGELDRESNVQKMHIVNPDKPVVFYNLDVIISVGYRVKSQRGTQFRQWATRDLHEHIVKGYTVNEQRLREEQDKLREMRQTVDLLARTLTTQELITETGREVLRVIYASPLTPHPLRFTTNNAGTRNGPSPLTSRHCLPIVHPSPASGQRDQTIKCGGPGIGSSR